MVISCTAEAGYRAAFSRSARSNTLSAVGGVAALNRRSMMVASFGEWSTNLVQKTPRLYVGDIQSDDFG
jgi:hypothetical protein